MKRIWLDDDVDISNMYLVGNYSGTDLYSKVPTYFTDEFILYFHNRAYLFRATMGTNGPSLSLRDSVILSREKE